ncbi:MAG: putative metallopeptidase [Candidatus Microgenomates bacterium]
MQKSLKYNRNRGIDWQDAPDVKKRVGVLLDKLDNVGFNKVRIFCFRSTSARTRAIARIWGFSKIWQLALRQKPAYVIEVISEKFDYLPEKDKDSVLLHEIAHIPNNFSGALVPHIRRGKRNFYNRVKRLVAYTKVKRLISLNNR